MMYKAPKFEFISAKIAPSVNRPIEIPFEFKLIFPQFYYTYDAKISPLARNIQIEPLT